MALRGVVADPGYRYLLITLTRPPNSPSALRNARLTKFVSFAGPLRLMKGSCTLLRVEPLQNLRTRVAHKAPELVVRRPATAAGDRQKRQPMQRRLARSGTRRPPPGDRIPALAAEFGRAQRLRSAARSPPAVSGLLPSTVQSPVPAYRNRVSNPPNLARVAWCLWDRPPQTGWLPICWVNASQSCAGRGLAAGARDGHGTREEPASSPCSGAAARPG
jgi:hypothetical protein